MGEDEASREDRGGFYKQGCGWLLSSGVFSQVGKLPGVYWVPTRFLASPILLKPLNIKLSWYTLQNLKFLFLRLPCRSLYSPSGCVVQLSLNTPDTVCFSGQRKWYSWSEGWWEANIQATFIPRPDSKGLCDLRNYPSRSSLFPESKTTGQCGLMCLHLSGVCTIAPVTLRHRAVVTALWGATVQAGREWSVALGLEWVDSPFKFQLCHAGCWV